MLDPRYRITDAAQERAWKPLLENKGLKRVLGRKRRNRGVLLYPGITSDDPRILRMMAKLAAELNTALPVDVRPDGLVGPSAVAGNFNALLTVAGYGMNPISTPPVSNALIRAGLNLSDTWVSQRHKDIAIAVFKAMFSNPLPAKVNIRREGSTCSPDYVNDVPKKKDELSFALRNLDRFLQLVADDNLLQLFIEFNAPIIQTIGERTQADAVTVEGGKAHSKNREVNDELAARTGLKEGRRFNADKRIVISGNEVAGHFAGRRRTVYGAAFVPNYVAAAFFACWREYYASAYEFTWKHRTPESILEKMRRFTFLAGFDVKQFDQTVPTLFIDLFCDLMETSADPRFAKLLRRLFRAPYIMPSPFIDGMEGEPTNPLFGADPFDVASFIHELGLPSGISCNPDFGKWAMTATYLIVIDDFFHDVLEVTVDRILRGEHDKYALLNMGDDCVVCTNSPAFHAALVAQKFSSPYFSISLEQPISFLGNVPYHDDRGLLQLAPNVVSFLINWLVPERGIDDRQRRNFWAIGDRERRQHYARAPSYGAMYSIYEETFVDAVGRTPSSIAAEYYDAQRQLSSLSFIDSLVLMNPDYLHYRFSESEVSPELLNLLVSSLPAEEVWPLVRGFLAKG